MEHHKKKKKILKNGSEWNIITKNFQKTTPTHLNQHTEGQTLIQRIDCSKDT